MARGAQACFALRYPSALAHTTSHPSARGRQVSVKATMSAEAARDITHTSAAIDA